MEELYAVYLESLDQDLRVFEKEADAQAHFDKMHSEGRPVKVEIQLRTIAMDFWASLEHELHYKTSTKVPESVRRELFRVAETIAMTDREMEEIAIELQQMD